MLETVAQLDPRVALAIHALAATATVAAVLVLAALLRDRRGPGPGSDIYESGAPVSGPGLAPTPTAYFQVAAFFVIFDFEAAVLFTWALSAPEAGVPGLISASVFILVLLAALWYLWADGALEVGGQSRGGAA